MKDMTANLDNLAKILKGHVSKLTFICTNSCGGSEDTCNQITESLNLLVASVRVIIKNHQAEKRPRNGY
eukprot:UN15773